MSSTSASLITYHDPPEFIPTPIYSAIVSIPISDTVTQYNISGQVAVPPHDPATKDTSNTKVDLAYNADPPKTLREQYQICLDRISVCLSHIGATKNDLAVLKHYMVEGWYDLQDDSKGLDVVRDTILAWLEGARPASTLILVNGLSMSWMGCEVEAVVYLKNKK